MPSGGKIAPDGRPPVAPGVGKTARRHDLEAPATPGLSDPSIQQGDVQRLEQAQRTAPRPKRTQPSAANSGGGSRTRTAAGRPPQSGIPDPVEFAGQKIGGGSVLPDGGAVSLDAARWRPLLLSIASDPTSSGPLTAMITNYVSGAGKQAANPSVDVFDQNDMERQIFESL